MWLVACGYTLPSLRIPFGYIRSEVGTVPKDHRKRNNRRVQNCAGHMLHYMYVPCLCCRNCFNKLSQIDNPAKASFMRRLSSVPYEVREPAFIDSYGWSQ